MMQALSLRLLANWSFAQDSFNAEVEAKTKQVIDRRGLNREASKVTRLITTRKHYRSGDR